MLTCGVGSQLHSFFGHSAIHVYDPKNQIDNIYNYGTFNFDTPNFYLKFAQGRLDYYLSVARGNGYNRFIFSYEAEGRSVDMQVFNLTQDERQNVFEYLENNAKEDNKYYKYDFFFDNCATRIHEVFNASVEGLELGEPDSDWEVTFRQMMWRYLEPQPWSQFGIDLVLGSPIDATMTVEQTMWHPQYVASIYGNTLKSGNPWVAKNHAIAPQLLMPSKGSWLTPNLVFWFVFAIAMIITFLKWNRIGGYFDAALFSTVGLLGVLLVFMWWGTDHVATKANYNLIWANPLHLIVPLVVCWSKLKRKLNRFYLGMAIIMFGMMLFWFVLPQQFNPAFTPVILVLGMRYFMLYRNTQSVLIS